MPVKPRKPKSTSGLIASLRKHFSLANTPAEQREFERRLREAKLRLEAENRRKEKKAA